MAKLDKEVSGLSIPARISLGFGGEIAFHAEKRVIHAVPLAKTPKICYFFLNAREQPTTAAK